MITIDDVAGMWPSDSTWKHLRIPFSFNLLPVFLFALGVNAPAIDWINAACIFLALHLFIYPASNGYNSYFDKDEESIGGLKRPPQVSIELYRVSLLFDLLGLVLLWIVSWEVSLMGLVYGLVSKAYSHPSIRLKKMPYIGWIAVTFFQGYFIFMLVVMGTVSADLNVAAVQFPAWLSTLMLFGSYPMTQVYQHAEDGRRGDQTISRKLGILGTFHFTAIVFSLVTIGYGYYYFHYHAEWMALAYVLALGPVLVYFLNWYLKVRSNQEKADFESTMMLNSISAWCLNVFFVAVVIFSLT